MVTGNRLQVTDMKMDNNMKNRMMILAVGMLMVCLLPLTSNAQPKQQDWQSTSTMQMSGSAYTSQVKEVGATTVVDAPISAVSSNPKAGRGIRMTDYGENEEINKEDNQDPQFPLGDAVLPLMLMALAYCGIVFFRRKRALNR